MVNKIFISVTLLLSSYSAAGDIRSQIDNCAESGCHIALEAGKSYFETRPWNLRDKKYFSITGHGATVYFSFSSKDTPDVAIDASGSSNLHFEGWKMALSSKSGKPAVGLLLARNIKNESSGNHHFERWSIQGWYRQAAVVSIASEVNVWMHCFISNSHPNATVYWTGRNNELNIKSPFGKFGSGSTNTCHDFIATGFGHYGMVYGDNKDGVTIVIGDGTHDFHVRGGTMSMRGKGAMGNLGGRSAVQLGTKGKRPVINILLDAVEWETVGAKNAVWVLHNVEGLTIRNSLLQSTEAVVYVDRSAALYDSTFEMNRMIGGIGTYPVTDNDNAVVSVHGYVEGCRFDIGDRRLIPLARDIPGRCPKTLWVAADVTFKDNDVRVNRDEDVSDIHRLKDSNRITKKKKR